MCGTTQSWLYEGSALKQIKRREGEAKSLCRPKKHKYRMKIHMPTECGDCVVWCTRCGDLRLQKEIPITLREPVLAEEGGHGEAADDEEGEEDEEEQEEEDEEEAEAEEEEEEEKEEEEE